MLLTDGSGLTALQSARRLASEGHRVEVLAPDPVCLCRFSRHVRRVHRVPAYGADPLAWLDAALSVYRQGRFDLLFPTQEQVAVLAAFPDRLRAAAVVTAVPSFAALASVQDKVSATATLTRLGLAQPETAWEAAGWDRFPAFVKEPIGTASGGVRRVASVAELARALPAGHLGVVQAEAPGPLAMCQSVFDTGRLVAFHATLRVGEGVNGGASHKRSVDLPEARAGMEYLGRALGWHGALSADVIVTGTGPLFIDINPRLVEPANAGAAGVDLVGALLDVARGTRPANQEPSRPGVATHQLLLAVLGAAQQGQGRRGVAREVTSAIRGVGLYVNSREELTPRGDLPAAVPLVMAAATTIVSPGTWRWWAQGSVENYALSPTGWDSILTQTDQVQPPPAALHPAADIRPRKHEQPARPPPERRLGDHAAPISRTSPDSVR